VTGRYQRQTRLANVGEAGQAKLTGATAVIVGCGALGTVIAENLARAGVGSLVLIDRDVVEPSNLQRQTLFTEADAAEGRPKAQAACERLAVINSEITLVPRAVDLHAGNVVELLADAHVVLDGTDNAATRYLVNDACVSIGRPWVYGAAVGVEGRVMPIRSGSEGPCLRCVFRDPPPAGSLATCDTAGVLGPAAGMVANLQSAIAIRFIVGDPPPATLWHFDIWAGRFGSAAVTRDPACPCCVDRRFEFLADTAAPVAELCGRDAVQVRLDAAGTGDLAELAARFEPADQAGVRLSLFNDARVLVQGVPDPGRARSLVTRYIGG
jgi:adenylyltransferase/sulfurtransferase